MDHKKLYIETYGCQMNIADSEVVAAVMGEQGYSMTNHYGEADTILINTCSIRDNAEKRIWGRLGLFRSEKRKRPGLLIGLIGCMAERLGEELLEKKSVDLVAGPDAYRDLPFLIDKAKTGSGAINVELTVDETYDSIIPQRIGEDRISGFVSITRGCNNFCTYCIVPYVRGRERSRDPKDIIREVEDLVKSGYREVTLLGQNVNSYKWNQSYKTPHPISPSAHQHIGTSAQLVPILRDQHISTSAHQHISTSAHQKPVRFPDLLERIAEISPSLRVRFTTSHPKDISDQLLKVIAKHANICRHIHLPVQSGSTLILNKMNRKYTREGYIGRIKAIREIIPGCGITTDILCGFCTETEEDHLETLSLMEQVQFDTSFMFKFSMRPGTYAHQHFYDDVPEKVKLLRLQEIITLQNRLSLESNSRDIGKVFEVLVEGVSKKKKSEFFGRSSRIK